MRHGVGEVEEERPVAVPLDEPQRPLGVAPGQGRLHDRVLDHLLAVEQLDRPHVVAVEDAEVLVEAAAGRQRLRPLVAEVPLADHAGGVAGLLEDLRPA